MALTRAVVDSILIRRAGRIMAAIGMDGVTIDGTNIDLNDPVGTGLRQLGFPVANIALVSDADVVRIGDPDLDEFLDLAELRLLESALYNCDLVNISVGPRSESLSDLRAGIEKAVEHKSEYISQRYGKGAVLEGGTIRVGSQQRSDVASIIVLPN